MDKKQVNRRLNAPWSSVVPQGRGKVFPKQEGQDGPGSLT